jgi:hypothetical protein
VPVFRAFLYISFRVSSREAPLQVPLRVPAERDTPFLEPSFNYLSKFAGNGPPPGSRTERHPFPEPYSTHPLSFKVPSKVAPFMFPNRVPMEIDALSPEPVVYWKEMLCLQSQWFIGKRCSVSRASGLLERDALSPEPVVYWKVMLCLQSQWFIGKRCSVSRANGLFIHLYLSESPVKWLSQEMGEKHTVNVHGVPCGHKAYIQWGMAWFSKWIVYNTAITAPVPCSLQHDTFHLGLGRPEPR